MNLPVLETVKSISSHGSLECSSLLLFDCVHPATGPKAFTQYLLVAEKIIFQNCPQFEVRMTERTQGLLDAKLLSGRKIFGKTLFALNSKHCYPDASIFGITEN